MGRVQHLYWRAWGRGHSDSNPNTDTDTDKLDTIKWDSYSLSVYAWHDFEL